MGDRGDPLEFPQTSSPRLRRSERFHPRVRQGCQFKPKDGSTPVTRKALCRRPKIMGLFDRTEAVLRSECYVVMVRAQISPAAKWRVRPGVRWDGEDHVVLAWRKSSSWARSSVSESWSRVIECPPCRSYVVSAADRCARPDAAVLDTVIPFRINKSSPITGDCRVRQRE